MDFGSFTDPVAAGQLGLIAKFLTPLAGVIGGAAASIGLGLALPGFIGAIESGS